MKRLSLLFTLFLLISGNLPAREDAPLKGGQVVTFTFSPGKDMFFLQGNEAALTRLYLLIDEYRAEIADGRMPLHVDGYCASLPTRKENLRTAFIRANRVKTELITHEDLKEADFVTGNYARAYHDNKDMVVVTLRIPVKEEPKQPETVKEQSEREVAKREEPPVVAESKPELPVEEESQPIVKSELEEHAPYRVAVRTNLLYDALLLPTLGVEWRINPNVGIKLDGSLSRWNGSTGKVQKIWLLNPEVRRYLLRDRRFYVGASGTYGQYNIYKYPLGNLMKDDTGYQGKFWNVGLTVGYQLRLASCLSVDFNLGLGYTRSEYDSYGVTDGVRVYEQRNQSKNFWGPTQAGISLMWTIGGNK